MTPRFAQLGIYEIYLNLSFENFIDIPRGLYFPLGIVPGRLCFFLARNCKPITCVFGLGSS